MSVVVRVRRVRTTLFTLQFDGRKVAGGMLAGRVVRVPAGRRRAGPRRRFGLDRRERAVAATVVMTRRFSRGGRRGRRRRRRRRRRRQQWRRRWWFANDVQSFFEFSILTDDRLEFGQQPMDLRRARQAIRFHFGNSVHQLVPFAFQVRHVHPEHVVIAIVVRNAGRRQLFTVVVNTRPPFAIVAQQVVQAPAPTQTLSMPPAPLRLPVVQQPALQVLYLQLQLDPLILDHLQQAPQLVLLLLATVLRRRRRRRPRAGRTAVFALRTETAVLHRAHGRRGRFPALRSLPVTVASAPRSRGRRGASRQSAPATGDPSRRRSQLPADPHPGLPAALPGSDALRSRARLRAGYLLLAQMRERVHDEVPKLQQRTDLIL